jgi:hypothetical protein
MPRQKGITHIDILRRKQAEIAEQLKAAETKQRERQKQTDLRRQDILGELITQHLQAEPESALAKSVLELLGRKLTRPADRVLFPNLPPLAPATDIPSPDRTAAPESAQAHAAPA